MSTEHIIHNILEPGLPGDGFTAPEAETVRFALEDINPAPGTVNAETRFQLGSDLVVTRDNGNAGQRFSLTGVDDSVMPYFQVLASTRTGTDGGFAVAGYQLHLGPDTGGQANREFFFIEAVGELHADGPHFRFGQHASGAGVKRPVRWENGNALALLANPLDLRMELYQELHYMGGFPSALVADLDGGTARTIVRATSYGNTPMQLFLGGAGGTKSAPTPPTAAKSLGSYQLGSRSASATYPSAQMRAVATEAWTFGTAHGSRIEFLGTPNGQASVAEFARLADPANLQAGLMVRVNRSGTITLSQVTIGAVDSGGSGYRVLRVAN